VAPAGLGVLLCNLGTPDAPTAPALKRYLIEFLGDPRVVDLPRWKWLPLLHGIIAPRRAPRSAALYASIWTKEGSPLLATSRRIAEKLAGALRARYVDEVEVALGMRYGNPSIAAALDELVAKGCGKILLFPLYPQYSAATTASTCDAFFRTLDTRRDLPEVRTVRSYAGDKAYLRALTASVRDFWAREDSGAPQRLLISFHGLPTRYAKAGDPYPKECERTAALLAAGLRLPKDRWQLGYQSRFGREEWLKPYTGATLERWGREGVESTDVICPGFAADCLETLQEIAIENAARFARAGGGSLRYIPALNDREDHIAALAALAGRHLCGWE